MKEVFFSIDVESDGPIPGRNSMLSLGCVAFGEDGKEFGHFSQNLKPLTEAYPDDDTMAWWRKNPEAYAEATKDQKHPLEVIEAFGTWAAGSCAMASLKPLPKAVALAYPAGFDWTFVYWYLKAFKVESPFTFSSCLDMKSYAAAILFDQPFRGVTKKNMPKYWFKGLPPHTHVAVDDAREQGLLFFRMREQAVLQGDHR